MGRLRSKVYLTEGVYFTEVARADWNGEVDLGNELFEPRGVQAELLERRAPEERVARATRRLLA